MTGVEMLATHRWVSRLGWTLIHFLWQGALIASMYRLARSGTGRPRVRYFLACAALLAMIATPLATFLGDGLSGSIPERAKDSRAWSPARSEWSTTPLAPAPADSFRLDDAMPWFVTAWFIGAGAFWLRLAAGWVLATRMVSRSTWPAAPEWQRTVEHLSERIGISRVVKLLTSSRVDVPTAIGWLRPVVLMPIGTLAGLPVGHIEALLAHELAHIRRHDYVVNILQRIAEATLFYHPAVWWISGEVRNEREHCCDDLAVSITGDAVVYAEALADLEASRPAHLSPALAANGGSLEDRIARLLGMESRDRRAGCAVTPGAVAGLFLAVLIGAAAMAQTPAAPPRFEVASIKPSPPDYVGFQSFVRGSTYTALTATVRNLIGFAYGIRQFQISGGPAWAESAAYNILAKMGPGIAVGQARIMVQTLLAERFGLKFHRVTRNRPGYALVIDKDGPKLVESKNPGPGLGLGVGRLNGRGADMRLLAGELSSQMEVPIADRTGLTALYDFKLEWAPDEQADTPGPSLSTALREQLGLKLEPVKDVPVEFFIIDGVHKPTEN